MSLVIYNVEMAKSQNQAFSKEFACLHLNIELCSLNAYIKQKN